MTISRDEWLAAFATAMQGATHAQDGLTTTELATALDRKDPGHRYIRIMLGHLIREGQAEMVMVQRPQINGVTRHVPGYRLKKAIGP